ncbi:MAG: peptidoglycan-binding domain-containing protein, partial [Cyanobacteria bacterium J06633_8]
GSKTEDVVKQFQQQRSLTVDGIVGSQTWSQLEQSNWDI